LRHLFDNLIEACFISNVDFSISLLEIIKLVISMECRFHDFKVCYDLNLNFKLVILKIFLIKFISMRIPNVSNFSFFFATFFRIVITIELISIIIIVCSKLVLFEIFLFIVLLLLLLLLRGSI